MTRPKPLGKVLSWLLFYRGKSRDSESINKCLLSPPVCQPTWNGLLKATETDGDAS